MGINHSRVHGTFVRTNCGDPESAEAIIRWAIHSTEIVPHLVLALLTKCLPVPTQDHETPVDDKETNEFWHNKIDYLLSQPTNIMPPPRLSEVRLHDYVRELD